MPYPHLAPQSFKATLVAQLREAEDGLVAEVQRLQEVVAGLARERERLQHELDLDCAWAADDTACGAASEEGTGCHTPGLSAGGLCGAHPSVRIAPCRVPRHDGGMSPRDVAHLFPAGTDGQSAALLDDPQLPPSEDPWQFDGGLPNKENGPGETSHEGLLALPSTQDLDSASPASHAHQSANTASLARTSLQSAAHPGSFAPEDAVCLQPPSRRTSLGAIAQDVLAQFTGSGKLNGKLDKLIAARLKMQGQEEERTRGMCTRLPRDKTLQATFLDSGMGIIILMNIAIMGISADVAQGWIGWIVVDLIFALIFFTEFCLKVTMVGLRDFVAGPECRWNIFEVLLVILAVLEFSLAVSQVQNPDDDGSGLSLFRVVRIFRVTRIVRVCRLEVFANLMVMIRGVIGGFHVLGWAIVLISLPLYAVALIFRETVGKDKLDENMASECFSNVAMSFFTLFRCIVGGDCTQKWGWPVFYLVFRRHGWPFAVLYGATLVFMTFGLFNVIVAIFVESVVNTAKYNEQLVQRQRLRDDTFFMKKMTDLIELIWYQIQHGGQTEDGKRRIRRWQSTTEMLSEAADMEITPELFQILLENPKFHNILVELDIADEDQFFLFQTLDASGDGKVSMDELMDGIAKLRGEARRSDIVAVHVLVTSLGEELRELSAAVRQLPQLSGPRAEEAAPLALMAVC